MTTGAGFVSFSTFIPLILRNHINFFWRWVTIPPVSSLCILCLSTWKIQWQKRCLNRGLQGRERERVRVRGRESQGKRHRDRERGGSRRIDFHLQQLQFKASQQTSEARQDPACPQPGRAACLRAGLPLGARDSQAAPEKQLRRQTRKLCEVTNAHYLKCHRKNNAVHCKYDVACYS